MKAFSYKSSNGTTYVLVKTYVKMGNKEPMPIYFFKTPETINKTHHEMYELPKGWGIKENPKNGYPLLEREFNERAKV